MNVSYDVLIIGTGAAGLGVALSLPNHISIALITKDSFATGASPRAQGGIAAVMNQQDNLESHVQDTLIAGAGLCDESVVRFVVYHAKQAIEWLMQQGVQFNKMTSGEFHLTQEGGHSHRRILHAADKTGDEIITSLSAQIQKRKNITCFTEKTAIDLLLQDQVCVGATILDNHTNDIKNIFSKITLLATGGASSVYLHASHPDVNSGDGIAMAYRTGAHVANLEFHQFHPTCLYHPDANAFLISEAARGEGGILKLKNGDAFMSRYDARKELAPRDIVARAIHTEMQKNHAECVYLDITHLSAEKIKSHFPTIFKKCYSLGIDITRDWIPVVPAAHYTCGGVKTNLHGETNVPHLFAVGEVASTGLHGANRMASNSLLECVVFAESAAKKIQALLPVITMNHVDGHAEKIKSPLTDLTFIQSGVSHFAKLSFRDGGFSRGRNAILPLECEREFSSRDASITGRSSHAVRNSCQSLMHQIKKIMWEKVGIVRNNADLQVAHAEIQHIQNQIEVLYQNNALSRSLIEARNLALIAHLVTQAALSRKKNYGAHFNVDLNNVTHPDASF